MWPLIVCLLGITAAQCQSGSELLKAKLADRVRSLDANLEGTLGVAAIDLETGDVFAHNGDSLFPQASSIKIPILIEVFRAAKERHFQLSDAVTLQPGDAVGGSGHLRMLLVNKPVTLTVEELAKAMIETSDNTATNRLIAMVGMGAVNATMERLGSRNTRLARIMLDNAAATRGEENVSTPLEMARLTELIFRGRAVDEDASRRMIGMMKLVKADFREAVPAAVEVASKPGSVSGVRCETGVIYVPGRPFVLTVMSAFLDDGANPVKAVARTVYSHFQKLSRSNALGNRVR
jgi:beta-lactamase class A